MPPIELKEMIRGWDGYQSLRTENVNHDEQLLEVLNLLNNKSGLPPHKREFLIREAMTTSDFPFSSAPKRQRYQALKKKSLRNSTKRLAIRF